MSIKRLVPLNTVSLASDPVSPRTGDIYYNSVDQVLKFYDGADWLILAVAGSLGTIAEHVHTYDGNVYSVGGQEIPYQPVVDGGTP